MSQNQPHSKQGMTLMETVIAIGVIAFAIPLILAATTASLDDRRNAVADTRSAWIARDLQDQFTALWASPRLHSYLPETLDLEFPEIASADAPLIFIFDNDGKFLSQGSTSELQDGSKQPGARFLATVHSKAKSPDNLTSSDTELAHIFLKIQYPAKAALKNRESLQYSRLMVKQQSF